MKSLLLIVGLLVLLGFGAGSVIAQELIIYPAKGQSQDQMEKDKFECYTWAKGQTGFDPMQMPTATSPAPSQEKKSVGGSALKGGAVGGIGGAIIGGIAGGKKSAGKGRPSVVFPAAPSVVCAARGKTSRPNSSASSGSSNRPTNTCSSAMPTTAPKVPALRAGGIP